MSAGRLRPLVALVAGMLPGGLGAALFRRLGWDVDPRASFGLAWVDVGDLRLAAGAKIGHGSRVGPLERVELASRASIGTRTRVAGSADGAGRLELAEGAAIVSWHFIDAAAGVRMGRFATLAGRGSQVWTHGWKPFDADGRGPVGAPVVIGDDCYVGSGAIVLPGVELAPRTTVAAGAVVGATVAARCPEGATLLGNPAEVVVPAAATEPGSGS